MSQAPDAPTYHYDEKLGNPRDSFVSVATARPEIGRPELGGRLVAHVDGETIINTMWGKQTLPWRAEPGTPCVILGYWADGSVQLRWPAIANSYRVEGRFPAWVVAEDPTMPLAGGGHMLRAHAPEVQRPLLGRIRDWLLKIFRERSD